MPQNRNSEQPPKAMTWAGAMPIIVVAVIFDLLRIFFEMFWFFGPAIAALYCTGAASDWVGSLWGLTATACVAVAGAAGAYASPATTAFGVVMAIAVGLAGWMTVGLILIMTNGRIFKENAIWFVASLAVSEVPIIGAIPALTGAVWKMYSRQIKLEKMALQAYEKTRAATDLQARQKQAVALQAAQMQAQEAIAANDASFIQAANDAQYEEIPEEVRGAA